MVQFQTVPLPEKGLFETCEELAFRGFATAYGGKPWAYRTTLGFYEAVPPSGGTASRVLMKTNPVSPRLTAMCCAEGARVHLLRLSRYIYPTFTAAAR